VVEGLCVVLSRIRIGCESGDVINGGWGIPEPSLERPLIRWRGSRRESGVVFAAFNRGAVKAKLG